MLYFLMNLHDFRRRLRGCQHDVRNSNTNIGEVHLNRTVSRKEIFRLATVVATGIYKAMEFTK